MTRIMSIGVVLALALAWSIGVGFGQTGEAAKAPAASAPAGEFVLRINVGGGEYKDPRGNVWQADKDFAKDSFGYVEGDQVDRGDVKIANTDMPKIFQTERYSLTGYKITVPAAGKYTLALLWNETFEEITATGGREFNVTVNGKKVLEKLDPVKEAGAPFSAIAKTLVVDVPDTKLITIEFEAVTQSTMLNGIVVMAGDSEKVKKAATEGVTVKEFTSTSMPASAPAKAVSGS
jgi:hypothetical protein